jgi:tetratricopeptide (TPR) repeat protein
MLRLERLMSCLVLGLITITDTGFAQDPPRKPPALIRDTGVAEGKIESEVAKKKEFNPLLAEQNLKIGDFYLKKKNYAGAIERYRDALEYQPNLVAAYDALGRVYEKKGDTEKALLVYRDFLNKYPESPKAVEFKSRISRLEQKK